MVRTDKHNCLHERKRLCVSSYPTLDEGLRRIHVALYYCWSCDSWLEEPIGVEE